LKIDYSPVCNLMNTGKTLVFNHLQRLLIFCIYAKTIGIASFLELAIF